MATPRWVGNALAVAQVDTLTVGGTLEADDRLIATINGKALNVAAGSTVLATAATTFAAAWEAADATYYPEFAEATAAATSGGALTVTADLPGVPFTVTASTTEAGGGAADAQTFVRAAVTANAGPNVWGTAVNWSTGAVPVAGDTAYIDNTDIPILYDLSQAGATLAALVIAQSFEGDVGLPKANEAGGYPEYRSEYLAVDCSSIVIGLGPGNGSGRLKINSGTVQTAVVVHNTGSPAEVNLEAFLWKGTHASNTLVVRGNASVGVAVFGSETAVIATLTLEGNARVRCGAGTTLTTVNVNGGTLEINSNVTTLTVYDGVVTVSGTAAVTTLNLYGGTVIYNSTGTLGTATVGEGGFLDFSQGAGAVTVSNPIDVYNVNPVNDPDKRVASLVIDYNGTTPNPALGTNFRLTRAATA